jgi:hypothetical protein
MLLEGIDCVVRYGHTGQNYRSNENTQNNFTVWTFAVP